MKASLEPYMNLKVVFLAIYRTGKQFDRRVKYSFLEHVEQENPSGKGVAKAQLGYGERLKDTQTATYSDSATLSCLFSIQLKLAEYKASNQSKWRLCLVHGLSSGK